jgi:hypothetical protein
VLLDIQPAEFSTPHKAVILRACDFFDLSCFLCIQPAVFKTPNKAVILSEALRRSIANRGLYGAESKDPGDVRWRMLLGAFRPQTTPEDKKVTNSERSASLRMTALLGSLQDSWLDMQEHEKVTGSQNDVFVGV